MKWVQLKENTYADVYKCSNCGQTVMVMDSTELPIKCSSCGEEEE